MRCTGNLIIDSNDLINMPSEYNLSYHVTIDWNRVVMSDSTGVSSFNDFLASKALASQDLSKPMKAECQNEVALRIGEDWESLATFIGIPDQDVHDIKEKFPRNPRDQRLALMKRWRQMYGGKASYLMMIKGLEQLGRRDIVEEVLGYYFAAHDQFSADSNSGLSKLAHNESVSPDDINTGSSKQLHDQFSPGGSSEPPPGDNSNSYKELHDKFSPGGSSDLSKPPPPGGNSNSPKELRDKFSPGDSSDSFKPLPDCNSSSSKLHHDHFSPWRELITELPGSTLKSKLVSIVCNVDVKKCLLNVNFMKVMMYLSVILFIIVSSRESSNQSTSEHNVIPIQQPVECCKQTCNDCLLDLTYRYRRQSDLPDVDELFIGREQDVQEVLKKLNSSSIVHITGAPGFGKSRLAIQIGHRIFDSYQWKINVIRYVDTYTHHSISIDIDKLITWSQHLDTAAILILDNCDHVLESDSRVRFLDMICTLGLNSTNNLQIILTSTKKLVLSKCQLDQWKIKPLNKSASVELLAKLSPSGTSKIDLTEIATLIQGSPLALRIIGGLLTLNGHEFAGILIGNLKSRPSKVLETADSLNEFHTIMDFVQESMEKKGYGNCGVNISQFPGSFNWLAGAAIVSNECIEMFLQYSLLDQSYFFADARFTMHPLIKDYFKENVTLIDKEDFNKRFYLYYIKNIRKHMKKAFLAHDEVYSLITIEAQNIAYFVSLLKYKYDSPLKKFRVRDLAVLAFLQKENTTEFDLFEPIVDLYKLYSENTYEVCSRLDATTCGTLYAYYIVSKLLQMCKCISLKDYAKNFLYSPCTKVFLNCDFVWQIYHLKNIWLRLRSSEQNYILRALYFHCNQAKRITRQVDIFSYIAIFVLIGVSSSWLHNSVVLVNHN